MIQQSLPDETGSATGSINVQLPNRLLGIDPGDLVAFRWDGDWTQIPVQVDEREVMDLNRPYTTTRPSCSDPCYNNPPDGGAIHPEFTDPDTFVGGDSDPTLDSNDEVALMAFDAGGLVGTPNAPTGVDAASAVEVLISDPIDAGLGYVYLFEDTSGLDPAAGQDYVDYEFNLANGPYKTGAYNPTGTAPGAGMNFGPRPETSFVETDNYRRGFTDRWYDNELRVLRGTATGVDILDRHDDQFDSIDASCVRTQDTFRHGEGAFVVNTDGPVRAIRDFVGANSGPHVQRQHVFYGGLEVINTFLRVHPIPGVLDFFDYSEDGVGLTYENGVMTPAGLVSGTPPGGVTIDGQPDPVTGAGSAEVDGFESVDGPQGGLSMPQRLLTNNPDPAYRLGYRDGNIAGQDPCNGDDELYGASGPQLNSAVNNTDEAGRDFWGGGQFSNLFYQRSIYYEAPGEANGPRRLAEMQAPLDLSLQEIDFAGESSGYARPAGAGQLRVPLALAYESCQSANRTHGGGIAEPSCNPASPESDWLTAGTIDANGFASQFNGSIQLTVCPDGTTASGPCASPPGMSAPDVRIATSLSDVRCTLGSGAQTGCEGAASSDYTGEVGVVLPLRLTDKSNGGASFTEDATVQDNPFTYTVDCQANPAGAGGAMTTGGSCSSLTSANAVVPGAVQPTKRAIWETDQIEVRDGGPDGEAATADNGVFARQGLFIP